jgi:N-acetylneuraminate synthase
MAAESGVKTVKFQMHIPEYEGIPNEPFRVKFSDQDENRQSYWRRVNFSLENWELLKQYCDEIGVEFLCTPFSVEAAKVLFEKKLVRRWKIGSGNATDWPLIDYVSETGMPLLISTGLVSETELTKVKERLVALGSWKNTTLLHCVSKYPANIDELDLHLMDELAKFGCPVGYSDHSGNPQTTMYAMAKGASVIEVHMTPHKKFFGPDVTSSLLPEEIKSLVDFSNMCTLFEKSNRTKQQHFDEVEQLRSLFRKGVYWSKNLKPGEKVSKGDLKFLKPVSEIDVIDYEKGADQHRVGPTRVTASGLVDINTVKKWAITCVVLGSLCGLPIIMRGGLPFLILGLLSLYLTYVPFIFVLSAPLFRRLHLIVSSPLLIHLFLTILSLLSSLCTSC